MSTPAQILNQIVSQLEDSSDLSYVENVSDFGSAKLDVFPNIIATPMTDEEEPYIHKIQDILFPIGLLVYIKNYDKDNLMTGSGSDKGLLDIRNDIAKAIYADRTLNGLAIKTDILGTSYDELSDFPIMGMAISLQVHFRQGAQTRT